MWLVLIFFLLKSTYINALSSFTIIKRLFSSSSFCVIRVWSSACSRLLIFLLAILIPTGDLSSSAFHMMYVYKLNKQGDNIKLYHTLSQFWTSLLFHIQFYGCFLTHIQVSRETWKWSGIPISLRIFMIWEKSIETYTLLYVKQIASGSLL